MVIPYKLAKSTLGKLRIKYQCPACKSVLENDLYEAGRKDSCPQCNAAFVVPGEEKIKQIEIERKRREEAKAEADALAAKRKQSQVVEVQAIPVELFDEIPQATQVPSMVADMNSIAGELYEIRKLVVDELKAGAKRRNVRDTIGIIVILGGVISMLGVAANPIFIVPAISTIMFGWFIKNI